MMTPPQRTCSSSCSPLWACWGVVGLNGPVVVNSLGIEAQALKTNRRHAENICREVKLCIHPTPMKG
jgi:hypothetical protein